METAFARHAFEGARSTPPRRRRRIGGSAALASAAALLFPLVTTRHSTASAFVNPSSSSQRVAPKVRRSRAASTPFSYESGKGVHAAPLFESTSGNESSDGYVCPKASTDDELVGGGGGRQLSRRSAVLRLAAFPAAAAAVSAATVTAAHAAEPEIDKSGQLFSPKAAMMGGGGSDAARGIKLTERDRSLEQTSRRGSERALTKGAGLVQDVYDARFIAYISRFLLNNDPAAKGWWLVRHSFALALCRISWYRNALVTIFTLEAQRAVSGLMEQRISGSHYTLQPILAQVCVWPWMPVCLCSCFTRFTQCILCNEFSVYSQFERFPQLCHNPGLIR
mmetsp:Transcript_40921/g.123406  ORF Transcript_40921/g.123406 Transcript_40921/m.123406 type:complete len:336 (+) Transcript_40921:359-1366(+)